MFKKLGKWFAEGIKKICCFFRIPIVKNGLLIVTSCLLLLFFLIYNVDSFKGNFLASIYELLLQLLMMGVTLGLGTVIYGCFDVVSFFKNNIKDVLIEDEYLQTLSTKKKQDLINKLEYDLIYNGYKPQPDCLYTFVKKKIEPLVKKCFFKNYSCEIFCEYDVDNNCIKKYINYNLVVSHIDPNESIYFDINSQVRSYFGDEPNNGLKIEKLSVGSNQYADKVSLSQRKVEDDGSGYIIEYYIEEIPEELKKDLTFSDSDLVISLSLISTVPDDDLSYSNRLSFPCSNYEFSFIYNNKYFSADPNVFCFMDTADGPVPRWNLKKTEKMSDIDDIDVNVVGWMLPGDGVSITLDKNNLTS